MRKLFLVVLVMGLLAVSSTALACEWIGEAGSPSKRWAMSYCGPGDYQAEWRGLLLTIQPRGYTEAWISKGGRSDTATEIGNTWKIDVGSSGNRILNAPADIESVIEFCINDARMRGEL
jgi:hypothetical protein